LKKKKKNYKKNFIIIFLIQLLFFFYLIFIIISYYKFNFSFNFEMSTIYKDLIRFGPNHEELVLIFINDLESWTESRLLELLRKKKKKNKVNNQVVTKLFI